MDFVIMVLLADSAAAGFLIFSFTASILILDKLGVLEDKGDENNGTMD